MALGIIFSSRDIYREITGNYPAVPYSTADLFNNVGVTLQAAYKVKPYNTNFFKGYIQSREFYADNDSHFWASSDSTEASERSAVITANSVEFITIDYIPAWITLEDSNHDELVAEDTILPEETIYMFPNSESTIERTDQIMFSCASSGNAYQTAPVTSMNIDVTQYAAPVEPTSSFVNNIPLVTITNLSLGGITIGSDTITVTFNHDLAGNTWQGIEVYSNTYSESLFSGFGNPSGINLVYPNAYKSMLLGRDLQSGEDITITVNDGS